MKKIKIAVVALALVAGLAWATTPALAQAERIPITCSMVLVDLGNPIIEQVGPLTRMTVDVLWNFTSSDPRLNGPMAIEGVWMIDYARGTATAHGKWTSALTEGGGIEGTWLVDGSGILRGIGGITGGELDGATINMSSTAGHPLLGWVLGEGYVVLPPTR